MCASVCVYVRALVGGRVNCSRNWPKKSGWNVSCKNIPSTWPQVGLCAWYIFCIFLLRLKYLLSRCMLSQTCGQSKIKGILENWMVGLGGQGAEVFHFEGEESVRREGIVGPPGDVGGLSSLCWTCSPRDLTVPERIYREYNAGGILKLISGGRQRRCKKQTTSWVGHCICLFVSLKT